MLSYKRLLYLSSFYFLFFGCPTLLIASQNPDSHLEEIFTKIDQLMEIEAYDSVAVYYKQALPLANKLEDKNEILFELGYTYLILEQYTTSISYYKQALNHALENTPQDTDFIADQYYYIAYCYFELEDFNQALVYNKKSLDMTPLETKPVAFAQTLSLIASIYFKKGDYDNAIIYEERALQVFQTVDSMESLNDVVNSKNGLALYYYFKQNYTTALQFVQSAILFYEKENTSTKTFKYITALNNYILILIKLEQFDLAQQAIQKALKLHQNENRILEITRFNEAFLNYKTQNLTTALTQFQEVIHLYQKKYPKGHTNTGKAHYYLGKIKANQKQYQAALQAYQKSLQALVPSFTSDTFSDNPQLDQYCRSSRNLLRTLTAKASVLGNIHFSQSAHSSQNVSQIFDTYDLAIEVADALRQSYQSEGSRYFLAEEATELFEQAVGFAYQMYEQTGAQQYLEKAFYYTEKNQSPILLQQQRAVAGQAIGGVPPLLIQKEKQLSIDLAFYKNQQAKASEKKDSIKTQLFSNYVFSTRQSLDSLQEQLRVDYPRYFEYQYNSPPISIGDLQQLLSGEQLFLQYYLSDDKLYLFVISTTSADLLQIKDLDTIQSAHKDLLATLQNPLTKAFSEQVAYEKMTNAAYTLYQQLLQPAFEKIPFRPNRLSITSNDFLSSIPFEALLSQTPQNTTINYLSLDYLVNDIAISYQPSAALMRRLQTQEKQQAPKEVLAIAPFSKTTTYAATLPTRSTLSHLPFTKKEVDALTQLFEVTALQEDKARKEQFLTLAPDYRILHLATHGVADLKDAAQAHLLFHPTPSSAAMVDSIAHILYNYEIQNLQLKADLAVLSACETGVGKVDKGEGLLSLARGFFYTGVPSLIMSKWKINDRSSSLIITDFYKNLKQNQSKDKALQGAKIKYLETEADLVTAHPFYWAGLVQLGNASPLDFGGRAFWWVIPLVFLLGFVFRSVFYKQGLNKKQQTI